MAHRDCITVRECSEVARKHRKPDTNCIEFASILLQSS